jgi:hypothetical protein
MKKKEKKMKKYKVTISTSDAYDLEIEAGSTHEAWAMADYLSSDEIKEKSYDSSPVDGFPMIVNIEEIKEE